MKKPITLLFLVLFLLLFGGCNQRNKPVRIPVYMHHVTILPTWKSGEVIRLKTLKSTSVVRKSGVKTISSGGEVELRIVKFRGNEWRCSWNTTDITNSRGNSVIVDGLNDFVRIFSYDFVLNQNGAFSELLNWKDIQRKGTVALDSIQAEMERNAPHDAALMANLFAENISMLESKEMVEDNFLQNARLYFALGGIEAVKDDIREGLLPIAYPFNLRPILQPVFIMLENAYSDSTCDVLVSTSMDMIKLSGALHRYADRKSSSSQPISLVGELGEVVPGSGTVVLFNVSLKTGLVQSLVSVKRMIFDYGEEFEVFEMKMVEDKR